MRGLAFLHDLGVVHRHVRPSNILLDRSGGAKIRDGCVARAFESYKESEDESASADEADNAGDEDGEEEDNEA